MTERPPEGRSSLRTGAKQGQRLVLTGDSTFLLGDSLQTTQGTSKGQLRALGSGKSLPQGTAILPWNLRGGMTPQKLTLRPLSWTVPQGSEVLLLMCASGLTVE